MPWRPLPRIAFGICVYPFQPSSAADLPLEIGDELYIIEQGGSDGSWYRGYLVAPPSLLAGLTCVKGQTLEARVFSGIFPRSCVEVREFLGEDRTRTPTGQLGDQLPSSPGRDAAHVGHGDHQPNGVITPSGSASPTPTGTRSTHQRAKSISKTDFASTLSILPASRTKVGSSNDRRMLGHTSWRTNPSEPSQQNPLPISPISVSSKDPLSPKPAAPVPMLKIGDETPTSASEPLVDEIASCLREWHSTKLHELLLGRQYSLLDKMSAVVRRLDIARRQLLHKVLTVQELEILRESTVWELVSGNKLLSGEVIVRSPSQRGRILVADDSAVEITRLQSMMSLLDERPVAQIEEDRLHHLLVDIRNFVGEVNNPTTVAMQLVTRSNAPGSRARPVSEVHAVDLPPRERAATPGADGRMKTLFVDLSTVDIGEGAGSGSQLYIIFSILANEPFRSSAGDTLPAILTRDNTPTPEASVSPSYIATTKGGRRSLMWGQKGRKSESSDRPLVQSPSTGSATPIRPSEPRPSLSYGRTLSSNNTLNQKFVKRTMGAGALRVDPVARQNSELEQDVILWTPILPMDEQQEDQDDSWDSIISEFCPNSTNRYRKLQTPNRLVVHVKGFADPDAETLIKKTPTVLQGVSRTRKIGFSGAPTKPRSDIYITLSEPFLPRNALLSHPKSGTVPVSQQTALANLQLTLEVRRSTGERIENCIYPSCNSAGLTAWRTCAVERGQAWNVTVRLAMSPEDVPGSHIVMSIADAPEFPFALCWMPLWTQGAFVRDGDHSLALYKYDEYTSSMISGRGAYLGLPWNSRKKDDIADGPFAALHLRTYLCSTKYSQDADLLGLLKWREQPSAELIGLLKRFAFVPEIEIVKLLNEVFDALFEQLVEYTGEDEYEDLVFTDLIIVLGIVHDRRFKLAPLVDQYAETRFNCPSAASCLLRSFNRLLADPLEPEIARKLRATFKVGSHVFKFIMRARQQQREKEINAGITSVDLSFTRDIYKLLESIEALMQRTTPTLIGTQTLVVQNFHTWLPEISHLLSPDDVLGIAKSFIDACASVHGKLILYKLILIINIVQLPLLNQPGLRRELFTNTVRWLAPHWGKIGTVTEQWKDQVRLCCSVLASQVQDLGPEAFECIPKLVDSYRAIQLSQRRQKTTLSLLFPTSYPFPMRPTTTTTHFDEALVEIAAILAEITDLPAALHLDMSNDDLADFLLEALQVYLSILDGEAFPKTWLSVHIYHHRSIMRSLEKVFSNLAEYFLPHPDEADQFHTELWRAFFDALLKLVGSDALALETFPEQKRRAVWKIAGDVRELGADLLRRSWEVIGWETSPEDRQQYGLEKMGGFQVQYVPGLVPPIVELCLSVHEGLRCVAIEVLQTMIVSEWALSQDLSLIQAEVIDCLDRLFKSKTITESVLQKLFVIELLELFEPFGQAPDDGLFVAVKSLIATVDELLDLLVAVHSPETSGEAFYIMNTLHLMDFLKDIQKEDIYIRYVHQLAGLQASARHFTEAGLALRLHADLYEWDPALSVTALQEPEFPAQSSFDRKEQLYFQMIKYFEEGQSWDNALSTYTELAAQYQHNVFDFAKLARTQRAMATIYETMSRTDRQNPRYFRVVYKGLGFPASLRDKQYIFQGSPSDRLATFTDRMQQQHPSAQILQAGSEEELEGQYLQIYPVSPQKDLLHSVYQRWKVAQPIRDHLLLSSPKSFTTSSRRQPSEANVREATVEKTVYTTAEPFPTVLQRSEIVSINRVVLTPIESAIERTTRKTSELLTLEKRVVGGDDSGYAPLTEALMVAVDQRSEGSVYHYRALLPKAPEPVDDEEDDTSQQPVFSPLETALKVSLVDHALAIKRCLGLYHRSAHQATRADLTQRFESTFAPELTALASSAPGVPRSAQTHSWFVSSSNPPVSTIPEQQTRSPHLSFLPTEHGAVGGGGGRPTRHEKNRLSLTFLKRGSIIDHNNFMADGGGGEYASARTSRSRSRDKVKDRLSFLNSFAPDDVSRPTSTQRSASRSSVGGEERPGTGRSISGHGHGHGGAAAAAVGAAAGATEKMLVGRVENVKKRFSGFNIGKKSSKNSVRSRVEEGVEEE